MSDINIIVREGVRQDTDDIVKFQQGMALETEEKVLDETLLKKGITAIFDSSDKGFYVVAENQGHIIGTLMVTREWSDWRNGQFWWIQSVYVVREFRRRGVYREMYQFVRERASSSQEVCGFRLYVEKDNEVAQKTYRSLGMMETPYLIYEEELLRP